MAKKVKVRSLLAIVLGIDSLPAAQAATPSGAAGAQGAQKDSEASLSSASRARCIAGLYKAHTWVITGFHRFAVTRTPNTQRRREKEPIK